MVVVYNKEGKREKKIYPQRSLTKSWDRKKPKKYPSSMFHHIWRDYHSNRDELTEIYKCQTNYNLVSALPPQEKKK
jgi:hypothetical protein